MEIISVIVTKLWSSVQAVNVDSDDCRRSLCALLDLQLRPDGIFEREDAGCSVTCDHVGFHHHVVGRVSQIFGRGVHRQAQRAAGVVIGVGGAVGGFGLLRLALVVQRHVADSKGFSAGVFGGQGDGSICPQSGVRQ